LADIASKVSGGFLNERLLANNNAHIEEIPMIFPSQSVDAKNKLLDVVQRRYFNAPRASDVALGFPAGKRLMVPVFLCFAAFGHSLNLIDIANVLSRITIDQQHVCEFTGCDHTGMHRLTTLRTWSDPKLDCKSPR